MNSPSAGGTRTEKGMRDSVPRGSTSITWAHLFLALFYAASILLFLAWISGIQVGEPPEALRGIVSSWWSWAITAAGGAIIALFFKQRLSGITLLWTFILIIGLSSAAYFLRTPKPLPPEHWSTTEDYGALHSEWDVTFDGKPFSCKPAPNFGETSCRAFAWGNNRAVERFSAESDKNLCAFFGTVDSGKTISGKYRCRNGEYEWSAIVR